MYRFALSENSSLTLGAHAQRGLLYLVGLSVCLSVRASSHTTGYEAAIEWHQRVLNNENMDINVAIFLKRLRSRDWRENKRKSQCAVDRARAISGRLYSAHASCQFFARACATPRWFCHCSLCFQWIYILSKVCSQCSIIVQVVRSLWMRPYLPIYKTSGESIETQKYG